MAKRHYSSKFISDAPSAPAHLPREVIEREFPGNYGTFEGRMPDLFNGVEEAMAQDKNSVRRRTKASKLG